MIANLDLQGFPVQHVHGNKRTVITRLQLSTFQICGYHIVTSIFFPECDREFGSDLTGGTDYQNFWHKIFLIKNQGRRNIPGLTIAYLNDCY